MKRKPMLAYFALALLLAGCATQEPVGRVRAGAPNAAAPIRLELGPVGVISRPTPAEFGFDKAEGRIEPAVDAAEWCRRSLVSTNSDPATSAMANAVLAMAERQLNGADPERPSLTRAQALLGADQPPAASPKRDLADA